MRSYCYEIPYWRSLFNVFTENFNLEQNHVSGIKFAQFCTAGGNEEYLQK